MRTRILATVNRETEKALQVAITYKYLRNGSEKTWNAWLPKSQATVISDNTIDVATWLISKIDTEIAEFQKAFKMGSVDFIVLMGK
ncbi:MAG: hypothetical protein PHV07_10020 [Oscillospiraceae bacterium]|nr:hypothetical protein [Oscillospiraceae bacterium]